MGAGNRPTVNPGGRLARYTEHLTVRATDHSGVYRGAVKSAEEQAKADAKAKAQAERKAQEAAEGGSTSKPAAVRGTGFKKCKDCGEKHDPKVCVHTPQLPPGASTPLRMGSSAPSRHHAAAWVQHQSAVISCHQRARLRSHVPI